MEEKTAFCPACRAPQIRVSAQPAESPEILPADEPETASDSPSASPPIAPAQPGRIQWNLFFRMASPLAALTGFLACLVFPIAILLVFPLSLRRVIHRYRPYGGPVGSGQGARLGAFMGLLSFASFLIFALPTLSLNHGAMMDKVRAMAAQNPDPQAQQMMLWFTTEPGFIVITVFTMLVFLLIFLAIGAISGALLAAPPKNRL